MAFGHNSHAGLFSGGVRRVNIDNPRFLAICQPP
jgi:hypothetical protein